MDINGKRRANKNRGEDNKREKCEEAPDQKNDCRKVCSCSTKKYCCVAKSSADRDHEGLFKSVLVGRQGTRNDEKSRRLYGARR